MSVSNYTLCSPGVWTQLYSGPSDGLANLWSLIAGLQVQWKSSTADPPFVNSGTVTTQQGPEHNANFWFSLPTAWAVIDVNPPVAVKMKIS
jgi:hypothetical protein